MEHSRNSIFSICDSPQKSSAAQKVYRADRFAKGSPFGGAGERSETERARMLPENHKRGDSIALTEGLLIAARRLSGDGLALSVIASQPQPGLRHPASASLSLASCWPLPQQLLPVSAAGGGRRRCSHRERLSPAGRRNVFVRVPFRRKVCYNKPAALPADIVRKGGVAQWSLFLLLRCLSQQM